MTFYERMQATATRLLDRFGQGTVVLTRVETEAPVAGSEWVAGDRTNTPHTLKATVSGVADEYVDGTTVLASDLQVICAVPPIVPALTDKLSIDGRGLTIVKVIPIPAAGTPAAYRLIVRG